MARGSNPGRSTVLEGVLVLLGVGVLLAAAGAGFALGRASAEGGEGGSAAAAETTDATATSATTETGGLTTVTGTTATTATGATGTTGATTGEDDEGGEDAEGAAVFRKAGCGSCHTFSAANASGTIGPNLDDVDLSKDEIEQRVRTGPGAMPAFEGQLTDDEIEAVADYVEHGGE